MREIEQRLGIARSTVSRWVREIELTDHQREDLQARGESARVRARRICYLARRRRFQEEGRKAAQQGDPIHAAGCMLYWAEGSKTRNTAQITNADPDVLRFFVEFLRRYFDVPDDQFRLTCNLFADHLPRQREVERFWLDTMNLPESCLCKSIVNVYSKYSQKKRQNRLPYGTTRVSVCRTHIVQHIYGAIQEYGGFDRPEWLD